MLTQLTVRNLVVVSEIDVEFERGLTVLSGETGSGKSILIEALGLALGERADSQLVRSGTERAEIAACFDLSDRAAARDTLQRLDADHGDECVLRRVVSRDGRSRAYVNGVPVTVQALHELGGLLVDVHSQHASLALLERDTQRTLLDAFGETGRECRQVQTTYAAWRETQDRLQALERDGQDRARLELLRYQVEELEAVRLDEAELAGIEDEHRRLANSASILEECTAVRAALDDDDSGAGNALRAALAHARGLRRLAPEAANLVTALEQAAVACEEAGDELGRLEHSLAADPARLERIDRRLAELHSLARKHQVNLGELATHAATLAAELAGLENLAGDQVKLRERLEEQLAAYDKAAAALTRARQRAGRAMAKDIGARLRELGIPHAHFEVGLATARESTPQVHGRDRVEFLVSTNPAQPPAALGKVASGGELSRIGLAIQAATARHNGVPVVVYDEVDTGIGGNTANIVGRNLREVARHCQVVCITHSPQVASAGDHHLRVDKRVVDGQAETVLEVLDASGREQEIARMLGAAAATAPSVEHARDLIAGARRE
ncbi:MAG: DNA repair protein RecN [Gammaproteobacteria bacterium]|nr:DNA repair protein RecN [Gammaproteobacteria bacterium]